MKWKIYFGQKIGKSLKQHRNWKRKCKAKPLNAYFSYFSRCVNVCK